MLCSYNLTPGQFVFALEDAYVRAYHIYDVRSRGNPGDLYAVYGTFRSDVRYNMARRDFAVKLQDGNGNKYAVFESGFLTDMNILMLPMCNHEHQVFPLTTLRIKPLHAIQVIHLVHHDTHYNKVLSM